MRLLGLFFLFLLSVPVMAAEVRVISAGAARGAVVPLIEPFQRESGHTIKFDYGTMGQIQAKLKDGQRADVLIVTTTVVAELEKAGTVVVGSSTPLGRTAVGVGVAKGEADLVVHQISEILPVKGVKLVGPLPAELQLYTTYTAGLTTGAQNLDAARAWIKFIAGPAGRKSFADRGMEAPN